MRRRRAPATSRQHQEVLVAFAAAHAHEQCLGRRHLSGKRRRPRATTDLAHCESFQAAGRGVDGFSTPLMKLFLDVVDVDESCDLADGVGLGWRDNRVLSERRAFFV